MYRVYFARDQLPPVGATIPAIGLASREERIAQRIVALMRSGAQTPPAGSTNPAALIRQHTTIAGGFTQTVPGLAVKIDGDVATVEFDIEDWGVRGAAVTQALVQQLVYTITEEPGLRRARLLDKGKTSATIDQLVVDKPLSREDVFGYAKPGSNDPLRMVGAEPPATLTTSASVDTVAPAMARFVVTLGGPEVAPPARIVPAFTVTVLQTTGGLPGKYELDVVIPRASDSGTTDTTVDRSPLRWYMLGRGSGVAGVTYRIGLDDLRPWRAVVLQDPTRIVIDVGGPPQAISDDGNTAVYSPAPGSAVGRTFKVSGVARAFEAAFLWRIRDARGAAVASGFGKASIGTAPVWGTYDVDVSLPATASGDVTLEVLQTSPRDGSEVSVASIPLTVR